MSDLLTQPRTATALTKATAQTGNRGFGHIRPAALWARGGRFSPEIGGFACAWSIEAESVPELFPRSPDKGGEAQVVGADAMEHSAVLRKRGASHVYNLRPVPVSPMGAHAPASVRQHRRRGPGAAGKPS